MIKGYSWILPGSLMVLQYTGTRTPPGARDAVLPPCPASPNCVSSQSPDKTRHIAPLRYEGPMADARHRLLAVISELPRSRVVTCMDHYIHCEFTSALFRFVDDTEFLFDEEENTIHVRSASRVGFSDLGVNRRRIEKIRKMFRKERIEK